MNLLPTIILIIAIIGGICGVYNKGYNSGFDSATREALVAHTEEIQLMFIESKEFQEKIDEIDLFYTLQQIKLRKEISRLKGEAIRYEQNKHNRCMVLNHEWVRMHNEAASLSKTTNTTSTGMDDGNAGAFEDNTKINIVVENYSTCALYIQQLKALQDYVTLILTQ